MGLTVVQASPSRFQPPARSRRLRAAYVNESSPETVLEAERLLREAGIDATCTEEVSYYPGGAVYNRVCRPAGSQWDPNDPSGSGYISADILTRSSDPAYQQRMVEVARQNIADIERSLEESQSPDYMGDPATIAQMAQIAGRTYDEQVAFMRQVRAEVAAHSRPMTAAEQTLYNQQAAAAVQSSPGYAAYQQAAAASAAALEAARQAEAARTAQAEAAARQAALDAAARSAAEAEAARQKAIAEGNSKALSEALAAIEAARKQAEAARKQISSSQTLNQHDQIPSSSWKEIYGGSGSKASTPATPPAAGAGSLWSQSGSIFSPEKWADIPTWAWAAGAAGLAWFMFRKKGR